jgi:hypothetical protein
MLFTAVSVLSISKEPSLCLLIDVFRSVGSSMLCKRLFSRCPVYSLYTTLHRKHPIVLALDVQALGNLSVMGTSPPVISLRNSLSGLYNMT